RGPAAVSSGLRCVWPWLNRRSASRDGTTTTERIRLLFREPQSKGNLMRFISPSECHKWLEAALGGRPLTIEQRLPCRASFALPTDTGAKTALARMFSHAVDSQSDGLFWITCWGV